MERIEIETPRGAVDGALTLPQNATEVLVVGHGAGNDKDSPLLVGFTHGLADGGIGSLRKLREIRRRGLLALPSCRREHRG